MWQRHANPWSGWTRSLTQPLMCVPLWTRSWKQGAALAVWLAVNPILFPPPKHDHAWMTRAIHGEHMWVTDLKRQVRAGTVPVRDWALWLDVGQALLLNASFYYAWRHRLLPMAVLNVGALVCNLWYLDKMAALYDERSGRQT